MKQCTDCGTVYLSDDIEVCENCGMDSEDYTDIFREDNSTLVDLKTKDMSGVYEVCPSCQTYFKESLNQCPLCKEKTTMFTAVQKEPIEEELVTGVVIGIVVGAVIQFLGSKAVRLTKVINVIFGGKRLFGDFRKLKKIAQDIVKTSADIIELEGLNKAIKNSIIRNLKSIDTNIKDTINLNTLENKRMDSIRKSFITLAEIILDLEHPGMDTRDLHFFTAKMTKLIR